MGKHSKSTRCIYIDIYFVFASSSSYLVDPTKKHRLLMCVCECVCDSLKNIFWCLFWWNIVWVKKAKDTRLMWAWQNISVADRRGVVLKKKVGGGTVSPPRKRGEVGGEEREGEDQRSIYEWPNMYRIN